MPRQRLNLTLDPELIERARRYSREHGTSISRLVGHFLASLPDDPTMGTPEEELTPTVRRLVGVAGGGPDRDDYRAHLLEKHDG
ncbi:MAG: DUF6364 family protein [Longimicrobiales bacterium]|nr:DUF6364 family protein [Longimicrobiales bacterium]